MLMLFVKWLGNLRREDWLILRKVRNDGGRHWPLGRGCALRRQSRRLILTLSLVLRDRFARKHDRLISRRRAIIVVATGSSGRRCRPLESRFRSAASCTVAAVKAVVPSFIAWFATNFTALGTLTPLRTRPAAARFAPASATASTPAKVARNARGVAKCFRRSRFRLFSLTLCASGFGKLPVTINRWTAHFRAGVRTRLHHRTICRDRFIQILVLLLQIHEIGDV